MAQGDQDRDVVYKGESITIRNVPGWYCPDCGESEPVTLKDANDFSRKIEEAIQAADYRQRQELRSIRKRLKLKQAEAAEIFGGGVNAFSEYERGVRKPNKSTVLLLRLLDRHPGLLAELREAKRHGKTITID